MMEQIALKNPATLTESDISWNPQKYYVDNLFLSLGIALISMLLINKFFGFYAFSVIFMITSQVHFLISYLFHYNVLKRTLTSQRKKLFFFLSFFPLVIGMTIFYYEWLPYRFQGLPFMIYFIVHMIRDEHVFYVQRSSNFKYFSLDKKIRTHMIFTILAFIAVLYINYISGITSFLKRQPLNNLGFPTWTINIWLVLVLVGGISALYLVSRREENSFLYSALYTFVIAEFIFLYSKFVAASVPVSRFNMLVIHYHNIVWYLFSIERVLYYQSRVLNSVAPSTSPVGYQGDPLWKFKHSFPHFLGLLLVVNLFFVILYGISRLEPFGFLDIVFNVEYLPLWSFPHITLNFYPKR